MLDTIRGYINDNGGTQSRAPPSESGGVKNSAESNSKYVKVSKQAWAQIQSRRMQKYGSRFDMMPDVDYIYANDRLFVVENYDESNYAVLNAINPANNKKLADEILEGFDNGSIRTTEEYNNWTKTLQYNKRRSNSNNVHIGNRRTARRNVGLDDTAGRSSDGTGATEKGGRNSRTKVNYSAEPSENVKLAEKHFGTTYKISEAGYILTDGKMLDFSGKHEGGRGGYRTVDHREIVDALGEEYGNGDYSSGMVRFMSEGNVRVSPESGGINLSVAPNKAQRSTLDRYISNFRGEVILDIDDVNGSTVASVEYPKYIHSSVVLNDIDAYFDKGRVPEKFSQEPMTMKELEAENKKLKKQLEYWRNQTRKNPKKTVREGDVKELAKAIIASCETDIKPSAIVPDLMELGNYIVNEKELRYTEVHDMAESIATELVENATADMNEAQAETHNGIKSYIKTTKLIDDGSTEFKELRSKYKYNAALR